MTVCNGAVFGRIGKYIIAVERSAVLYGFIIVGAGSKILEAELCHIGNGADVKLREAFIGLKVFHVCKESTRHKRLPSFNGNAYTFYIYHAQTFKTDDRILKTASDCSKRSTVEVREIAPGFGFARFAVFIHGSYRDIPAARYAEHYSGIGAVEVICRRSVACNDFGIGKAVARGIIPVGPAFALIPPAFIHIVEIKHYGFRSPGGNEYPADVKTAARGSFSGKKMETEHGVRNCGIKSNAVYPDIRLSKVYRERGPLAADIFAGRKGYTADHVLVTEKITVFRSNCIAVRNTKPDHDVAEFYAFVRAPELDIKSFEAGAYFGTADLEYRFDNVVALTLSPHYASVSSL